VFGKQVRVVQMDIDRYDRVVGMVYVGDVNVNEALVKNGLTWVYQKYCSIEACGKWLALESQARDGKVELWEHPNPVPPWNLEGVNGSHQNRSLIKDTERSFIMVIATRRSSTIHREKITTARIV
jgi:endonuclease YncB( thermonuclease family)